jgi:hypothetical protein
MRKQILVALLVLPLAAFAQAPGAGPGPGPGQGQPQGQGRGMGPGKMHGGQGHGDPARMERRMRLVRTLGLAEALDLDEAQALKLGQQVAKFDEKRLATHKQLQDAHQTLRRAASGEKVSAADVDQAIKRALDARAQLQSLDRDVVNTVTKDLSPEKRARAVLFLSRFEGRFGHGGGMMGRGHGPGMMHGRGGMGMGMGMEPGQGGMAMGEPGACPDCPFDEDDDE